MNKINLLLPVALCCLIGYSTASSCSWEDVLGQDDISIVNVIDENGIWETIVKNHLESSISSTNSNFDIKRHVVEKDGKKSLIVTMSLQGKFLEYAWRPLRFHFEGGKNLRVHHNRMSAQRTNENVEEEYGGVLTNRPLQDNELFQVRIDKLISKYSTSLGIGITKQNLQNVEYPRWMSKDTIMLYNYHIYTSGEKHSDNYGPNLRDLKVGDRVGVMKTVNGDLRFFVNGNDLGVAATGIHYPVYGVLDIYGNTVEVSLA